MKKYIPLTISLLAVALLLAFAVGQGQAQQANPEGQKPADPQAPASRSSNIPVQGRLTDASGNPLNGVYTLTFRLYDVSTGGTVLCEDVESAVVEGGLFNTYMSMQGCGSIDGRQLYLGIQVGADPDEMTPRQPIDNVVYAWTLRPGAEISSTIGNDAILDIDNYSSTGRGLRAEAQATTGVNYAVIGASRSLDGYGGYFYNNGGGIGLYAYTTSNVNFGVVGLQDSYSVGDLSSDWESGGYFGGINGVVGISHETVAVGAGVLGWAQATTGTSYGVRGRADSSTNGYGVYGHATASTGNTRGVYGVSESTAGRGVYGYASAASGTNYGVYGESNSSSGRGVYGLADVTGGIGVAGESEVGSGVYGQSSTGFGIYGLSTDSNAVNGDTQRTDHNYGLYTADNLYSLNYHLKGAVRQLVQNGGSEPLEAGDVVVFSGIAAPADANDPPIVMVSKASAANSTAVAGVVYARSSLEGGTLEGAAQPGEYLLLVVQGPARVKVSAAAGAIQPGDLLSSTAQAGVAARPAEVTLLPGTVFAKALEALESGEDWIYVYVTLQ